MSPEVIAGFVTALSALAGGLAGMLSAHRALRAAQRREAERTVATLTAGFRTLLDERAELTRDVFHELADVKKELATVREENRELVDEVAALRAGLDDRSEQPPA
ncbi:hypothetical protein GCM10012275_63740 [Longimycelium tulufanense]|uniref:Uncharacterized protein n=1 Tax=Longimycelium tulufanense TaxID=907463 RepID=A0A8J3FX88_9PSEU|nr:hypothetical protein [Longimycelium tulufanense]GGM84329.1 hypothetical protein GCM10012275_63740 [Longimycelium tulufanense]